MDELIIDEFEIETETDNLYSEDIIDSGIEILNIEAADSVDDLVFDLIYQTEFIETDTIPETETVAPETELLEVQTETVAPETELLEVQIETVASETELLEVQTETVVPETEILEVQTETVAPETELLEVQTETLATENETIVIENIASEHLDSLGVLNETHEDVEMDKAVSDQQIVQKEILSDNKVIDKEDPEEESEFSFVELVKDNSKDEILKDGSDSNNTLYDIDDIYNLISLRIPENSRLFTSQHNLDDIYDLLSDSLPVNLLPAEYVRSLNKEDELDVVEVVEESKRGQEESVESESETTSIDDIYDLIDQQNKILLSNQEIEIAILQNQKTMSDNDNKMNTFLVSGVFAVLGAVVISNLFRGIK